MVHLDIRYLIIIADGLIVTTLLAILTYRLLNRALGPLPAESAKSTAPNRQPTLDELNIDIPL